MDNTIIYILLALIGIAVGAGLVIVINTIKGNAVNAKSKQILESTKKEADKLYA